MGAAQEKRLKELERKVALFAEQREKLEAQAEIQLNRGRAGAGASQVSKISGGSTKSSSSSAPAISSERSPCEVTPAVLENSEATGIAGCLAAMPLMDVQDSVTSLASPSAANEPRSELLLEMERERELWESKMAGFRAGLACFDVDRSRPASASSVVPAAIDASGDARNTTECRGLEFGGSVQVGTSTEIVERLEIAGEAQSALGDVPEVSEQLQVEEDSGSKPNPSQALASFSAHASAEVVPREASEEAGSSDERPGGLIAAALRAAGLEVSSAEEAAAELMRRAQAADGTPTGEGEERGAGQRSAERARPSSGSSARRWAAERMRRKRGILRTPGNSAAPSRAATPALRPPAEEQEEAPDDASDASP